MGMMTTVMVGTTQWGPTTTMGSPQWGHPMGLGTTMLVGTTQWGPTMTMGTPQRGRPEVLGTARVVSPPSRRAPQEFVLQRVPPTLRPLALPPGLTARQALERVLRLPAMASKRYLTNKVLGSPPCPPVYPRVTLCPLVSPAPAVGPPGPPSPPMASSLVSPVPSLSPIPSVSPSHLVAMVT